MTPKKNKKYKRIKLLALFIVLVGVMILIWKPQVINEIKLAIKQAISTNQQENIAHFTIPKSIGTIYGIDVSHHQGKIDWSKVKDWNGNKISFVYIKSTEGATYVDATYARNLKEAKANGFLVGSYHFFRTTSSAKKQFNHFIKNIDKDKQDLIPIIDIEEMENWESPEFHTNFKEFLILIEEHFGKKPIIYTFNSFYNDHLAEKYKNHHFIIGRYGGNKPYMKDKSNWTIWQFSETGKIKGISEYVDIDIINAKYQLDDIKFTP